MDQFKSFGKSIADFVGRMSPSQVMMLFGVVAGTIVGVVFLVGWIGDVDYARLYSNLDEAEAGEIAQQLGSMKIPYQVADNGTAIEVPSSDVYKTRIALAAEGIPRSGNIGYSIFDQSNLGMTDFLQNLNFRRALEGELTKTITQMREVKAARVHIVMPKERLFRQDKLEATASVMLKLSGRFGLSKSQLDGITHLVAASVEGLKPGNIAIVDYDGNLLSSGRGDDEVAGLSSTQLEVRKNVESYLQDKAQTMLDGVLGGGHSLVRVTADLDFQQLERTSETYDPNTPSIRSEERTKTTNAANDKADETSESSEENNTETTITNYELNRTVEHIIGGTGGISRLSLAVTVDGTYEQITDEAGEVTETYQPRSQEELDRIAALVKSAVGYDAQRNDQIEIVNIPFNRTNIDSDREALDSMYQREFIMDIAKKVGMVLLALIGLMYFRKKSKKLFGALKQILPPPPPPSRPQVVRADEPKEEEEDIEVKQERRKPRLADQMQKAAQDKPEEIAKVIKTMMIE